MAYTMKDARIELNNVNLELKRLGYEPMRFQVQRDGGRGSLRLMQSDERGNEWEASYRMTPDQMTKALDAVCRVLRNF